MLVNVNLPRSVSLVQEAFQNQEQLCDSPRFFQASESIFLEPEYFVRCQNQSRRCILLGSVKSKADKAPKEMFFGAYPRLVRMTLTQH